MNQEARAKAAAGGIMPLDYMLKILRDENAEQDVRMDAAKAAAPYLHAKLAAIEHTGADGGAIQHLHEIRRLIVDPKGESR